MKRIIALMLTLLAVDAQSQPALTENLILITADGIRWQEIFRGIDQRLVNDERYTPRPDELTERYAGKTHVDARAKLFPFLWSVVAEQGVLVGNRDKNSAMALSNQWYFSYPGYNEILTGKADPDIQSNDATPNPNVTFLEWLHRKDAYRGRVFAFGSWDVFPAIINETRSGIPVNAGFDSAEPPLSQREQWLNELQPQIPSPWHNVRLDAFTHHYALETLKQHKPRVLYIAYGETDDFAHNGHYHQYIEAAHRFDRFVAELWRYVQSQPEYRNKTTLLIATDHGRGEMPLESWQHHGSMRAFKSYLSSPAMKPFREGIDGADHTWMAALGPGIRPLGEYSNDQPWFNSQLAATALRLLGHNPAQYDPEAGGPLVPVLTLPTGTR